MAKFVNKEITMIPYDAEVLQKLANKLHAQTATVAVGSVAAGLISGSLFGYAATLIFRASDSYVLPGLIVGGVIGFVVGRQRARALRLQAQIAACLVQIEKNTRVNQKPEPSPDPGQPSGMPPRGA
jgi:uncharacterized membrane protein YjfL (UPF0719 family)